MRAISRRLLTLSGALMALAVFPGAISAQRPAEEGWNTPGVLDLVRRGTERRATEFADSSLRTYSARGDGYVYFLIDATDLSRESLVRTDQVAVDFHWRAPSDVRQRIVGLRDQRELPITGLYYYLDRLTIVHDDYGQSIVIADGDNVRDVPHPIGLAGEERYDYRLVDSLTIRLPGLDSPVRVQEIRVRPKDPDTPAVIGSVFLEVDSGAVVRMTFTFTPSSYIDPRLDHINVTLENGLWRGRYWLPHEQRLEVRREMPELELPFGTVIRTRMRIGGYVFNEPVPEDLFRSSLPITMAPEAERKNFAFDRPIDAEWRDEGFGAPATVEEIQRAAREVAREMARARVTSGLPGTRLALGSISDVFRFNRAEGATAGLGLAVRPGGWLTGRIHGGWAFGAGHPVARLDLSSVDHPTIRASAYLNRPREMGGTRTLSGTANTLSTLFAGRDWLDPFYASGGSVTVSRPLAPGWSAGLTGRAEQQKSARVTTEFSFGKPDAEVRAVRPVDRGTHLSATATLGRDSSVSGGAWGRLAATIGNLDATDRSFSFGHAEVTAGYTRSWSWRRARAEVAGRLGTSLGTLPRQELTLLGGRGTLPGYEYRAFGGTEYATLGLHASGDLLHPWFRLRLFAGAGWTHLGDTGREAGERLQITATDGVLPTLGAGLGLFYDLFRIDFARGVGEAGEAQIIIEFPANFWDFL